MASAILPCSSPTRYSSWISLFFSCILGVTLARREPASLFVCPSIVQSLSLKAVNTSAPERWISERVASEHLYTQNGSRLLTPRACHVEPAHGVEGWSYRAMASSSIYVGQPLAVDFRPVHGPCANSVVDSSRIAHGKLHIASIDSRFKR